MYVHSLYLKNLRCFREADLTFQYPGRIRRRGEPPPPSLPNVNLILGNNGAGKTTVLKGIALSLLAPMLRRSSGFNPYALVRRAFYEKRGAPTQFADVEAKVVLGEQDLGRRSASKKKETLSLRLQRIGDNDIIEDGTPTRGLWRNMFKDDSPAFLVLGYGATRRVAPDAENLAAANKQTALRFRRVQGLFDEGISLMPLSRWLPNYPNRGRRSQVIKLVDELVGDYYTFEGKVDNRGDLLFRQDNANVPFGALSDGFRAFIAWVGDMLFHICTGCPPRKKLTENEGVVLLDEVDLHLHPDWQRVVIARLARTFPRIQFILTSHSPLVTGSLEWSNIWVMSPDGPRQLPDEPIYGLSADQVLQGAYFNLDSTRPPEVADALRVLDQKAQQGDRGAALQFMQRLASGSEGRVYRAAKQRPARKPARRTPTLPTTSL